MKKKNVWWIGIAWHSIIGSCYYRFSCSNLSESEKILLSKLSQSKLRKDDYQRCLPQEQQLLDKLWKKLDEENEFYTEIEEQEWQHSCDYFINRVKN